MASKKTRILIIIPFYNEDKRILKDAFFKAFSLYNNYDFLLVDDSSKDNTPQILESFSDEFENVFSLNLKENNGKAEAIRKGLSFFNQKYYDYIGFLDADLATPFEELVMLEKYISSNPSILMVMGTRIKLLGNNVNRSLFRHYFGRVFATIISQFILKIPVYDTQCGAKIFDAKLARMLFDKPFVTKWLFDVELLLRFKDIDGNFHKKIVERPLQTWEEKGESKIKVYEFMLVPYQIVKIYFKYVF